MTFEWNPVLSGLVGGLVAVALGLFVRRAKRRPAATGPQVLRYHGALHFFVVLGLGLVGVLGWAAASQWPGAAPGERLLWVLLEVGFVAATIYFLHFLTVRISIDEEGVDYRDLFGTKRVPWGEVVSLRYSVWMQEYTLRTPTVRLCFNQYLVGHQELLNECSRRTGLPVPGEVAGSQP